jgi:hypothetical protein
MHEIAVLLCTEGDELAGEDCIMRSFITGGVCADSCPSYFTPGGRAPGTHLAHSLVTILTECPGSPYTVTEVLSTVW